MPKKPDEPRAATQAVGFQLRFQERTRARLEQAAKENGASLNSEIVSRLDQSLAADDRAGSVRTQRMFDRLAATLSELEETTGKAWTEDPATFAAARRALLDEILNLAPPMVNEQDIAAAIKDQTKWAQVQSQLLTLKMAGGEPHQAIAALGLPSKGRQAEPIDFDASIQECDRMIEAAEQQEAEASAGQREAEAQGRALHRNWRADRQRKAGRAYGA